ncbi:MAG: ROK family protein [Acidimicrobiales bacterium]|jgi:glucokinase
MRPVLALDIGGTKLAAGMVDADGEVRGRLEVPTRPEDGAELVFERAVDLAARVREEQAAGERVTALGVSTKGLTRDDGVLISGMPGWSGLRIPLRLRERFPDLVISVMNDVKAATLAEMTWGELRGVRHGVYMNLGTGIAAGIVVGGEILEGAHGAAGEIGYLLTGPEVLRRSQHHAASGEDIPAPLEELIGGRAVPERARSRLGSALTMEQLTERSGHDAAAAGLLEDILSELAIWVANVAVVVDPQRVVIGGGFLRSPSDLCARVRKVFEQTMVFPPEVEPAHFHADSALVGAGALALRSEAAIGLAGGGT